VVNAQINSIDVFSQEYRIEPKDNDEIFYQSISKRVTLSAGNNTIQVQLSNDGSGTGRIFEANVQLTKI
jgi:ABC-type phosphate transport system substrate-binding protein